MNNTALYKFIFLIIFFCRCNNGVQNKYMKNTMIDKNYREYLKKSNTKLDDDLNAYLLYINDIDDSRFVGKSIRLENRLKDKDALHLLKLFGIIYNYHNYDNRKDTLKILGKLIRNELEISLASYNTTKDLKIYLELKNFFSFIKIDHLKYIFSYIEGKNYKLYKALAKFLPPEKISVTISTMHCSYSNLKNFVKTVLERADSGYIKTLYPWDRDTILYYLESIKKPSILNRAFTNFEIQNRRNQEFCINGYIRELSEEYNMFIPDVIYSLIYKQTCFDELEYDVRNLHNSRNVNFSFRHPIKYLQLFKRVKNITTPNYDSSWKIYFESQRRIMLGALSIYIMSKFEEKHKGIENLQADWDNFFKEINKVDLNYMLKKVNDKFMQTCRKDFYCTLGRLLPIKTFDHLKLNIKTDEKKAFFNALVDREDINKEKLDYISKIHGYEFARPIKEISKKGIKSEFIYIAFLIIVFVIFCEFSQNRIKY